MKTPMSKTAVLHALLHLALGLLLCLLIALLVAVPPAVAAPESETLSDQPSNLQTLTGTLYGSELVPKAAGKIPVVLLLAGSGPTDRNGNTPAIPGANNSLGLLAEALASAGIASVRYDKRGIAASKAAGGSEMDLRFDHYVNDAAAWVGILKADTRFSKVIVAGHSEGSAVGMLAARKANADAYISIAGIARSADQVILEQLKPRVPPELFARASLALQSLKKGETVADPPKELAALFRPSVQPYLISWLKYTPGDEIRNLMMPVLILQGTTDIQVSVAEANALGKAKPDAQVVIIEGMNHVMKMAPVEEAAQKRAYSDGSLPVSEKLTTAIIEFVKALK